MIDLIEQHRDALANLCRRYHVARLEVFGSAATGDFDDQTSDLDFLVQFGDVPGRDRFDNYFGLFHSLEKLFGRPVDLVEEGAPRNPHFVRRLNESRRPV